MANNRMYLVYKPTGRGAYLGKRMGWGWYGVPDELPHRLNALFEHAITHTEGNNQDAFCLAMEDGTQSDGLPIFTDWNTRDIDEDTGLVHLYQKD